MDMLDRLLDHDRWTTLQVLASCRTLPPQKLDAPLAIGPGSVGATLRHMIGNVQVWTDLMYGWPVRPTNAVASAGIEELPAVFDALYADFAAIARRLRDDGRLDELYLDVLDDPPSQKSFGGTIAHVITHNMHHRAEILNMLGKLDVPDLPEGDVLSWEAQMRA
jgi:uncharacterized damage-inducible protein DinB